MIITAHRAIRVIFMLCGTIDRKKAVYRTRPCGCREEAEDGLYDSANHAHAINVSNSESLPNARTTAPLDFAKTGDAAYRLRWEFPVKL